MDCLLCYKMFIGEKEFENCNQNPELCKKTLLELFGISRNPDVQGLSEDLALCQGCHRKLENVGDFLEQLEELQRRADKTKIEIKQALIKSKKVSEVMAKDLGDCMSKSSLDRLVLLKAIGETGNTSTPTPDHDGIDAEHSNESFVAQVQPSKTVEPEIHNSANGEVLPIRATKPKELLKICSKSAQILPGVSTINQVASSSKSRTLRNQKPASNEKTVSDSKPGDGSSSEDDADGEFNNRSKKLAQVRSGKRPKRAPGSVLKEYTRLKNGLFQCKHCFKITKNGNLSQHSMIHKPRSFKCTVQDCEKMFTVKSNRDIHVKTVHEGRRDFKCTLGVCGKRFGEKRNLTRHVQIIHERRRDFKCGVGGCDHAFGTKRDLNRHMSAKHEKIRVAKKKGAKVARVISPQVAVKELKVQVFDCRMTPSCRRIFLSENARDAHEESHAN